LIRNRATDLLPPPTFSRMSKPSPAATPPEFIDHPAALAACPSPAYIVDLHRLENNLRLLDSVQRAAGCTIILALKGFAMHSTFPLVRRYLRGTTASGIHEALLGAEHFGGEIHVYSPAYTAPEMERLLRIAHHLSFNSPAQWLQFRDQVRAAPRPVAAGLRVNPEHSEVSVALYDPAAPGSRLGITQANLEAALATHGDDFWRGLSGLHFHSLCEQDSDVLERTLAAFERRFGQHLARLTWVNFGGGHHITRPGYDVDRLIRVIREFRTRHPHLQVYLEPGEAIALHTGYLVATVLDVFENGVPLAILDTSVTAHMPDVLEMPYRPVIIGGAAAGAKAHTYRLGGLTCLAGDVIGDWSFDEPLAPGRRLVFTDMAHYTMVKNTTFNGVPLPALALYHPDRLDASAVEVVRTFGYEDYRMRLS